MQVPEPKPSKHSDKRMAENLEDFAIPTTINNSHKQVNRHRADKPEELDNDMFEIQKVNLK